MRKPGSPLPVSMPSWLRDDHPVDLELLLDGAACAVGTVAIGVRAGAHAPELRVAAAGLLGEAGDVGAAQTIAEFVGFRFGFERTELHRPAAGAVRGDRS